MFAQSETINEIAGALAKAQGEVENAKKDADNPHFKSKYADLASIRAACQDALAKHSIAVIQAPGTGEDGAVTMTTILAHSSGQWMRSEMACKPMKNDAQGIGSVITYLRRYALAAMVGVAPDEDDDGEGASGRGKSNPDTPQMQPARTVGVTRGQTNGGAGQSRPSSAEAEKAGAPDPQTADGPPAWVVDLFGRKHFLVAVPTVDSPEGTSSDWPGWGNNMKTAMRWARTLEEFNKLWSDNEAPRGNAPEPLMTVLSEIHKKRLAFFSQAPNGKAA